MRNLKLVFLLSLLIPSFLVSGEAFAGKKRSIVNYEGKVAAIKTGRDKKKRKYWEYTLTLKSGEKVVVHDYKTSRSRQPASVGLKSGAKKKVKGFFVRAITVPGGSERTKVLIVEN